LFPFRSTKNATASNRSRKQGNALRLEPLEDRFMMTADMVIQWNQILLQAIRVDGTPPPKASRAMAIVHTAIYDAVNAIDRTHEFYLISPLAPPRASLDAAVAAAAHESLIHLFPAQSATFDAEF